MTVGPVRDIEVGDDRVGVSAVRQIDKRNGRDCLVVGQVVGTGHQGCPNLQVVGVEVESPPSQ